MLNKKLAGVLVIVVVVLVAVAVWVGMRLNKSEADGGRPSAYSAVMLANGDVYFGKFTWFPSPRITNAWILQRSVDEQNRVQLGVVPANRAFWEPVDEVSLNSEHVVSWTRLRKDSQLVQAIENPDSLGNVFEGPAGGPPANQ